MFLRTQTGNVALNLNSIDYIAFDRDKKEIRVTVLTDNPGLIDKKIPVARYEDVKDAELVFEWLMAILAAHKFTKTGLISLPNNDEVIEWTEDIGQLITMTESRK